MIITQLTAEELTSLVEGAVNKTLEQRPEHAHKSELPITRAELMRRLNVTEPTIIRWERKGKIPFMCVGNRRRYDWNKVLKSLEVGGR